MKLLGLRIAATHLDAVSTATADRASHPAGGGSGGVSGRVVSAEVLAETRRADCRCEDEEHMAKRGLPTLHAGTPVVGPGGLLGVSPVFQPSPEEGVEGEWTSIPGGQGLGSGCTDGWVCNRLTTVRRRYGV